MDKPRRHIIKTKPRTSKIIRNLKKDKSGFIFRYLMELDDAPNKQQTTELGYVKVNPTLFLRLLRDHKQAFDLRYREGIDRAKRELDDDLNKGYLNTREYSKRVDLLTAQMEYHIQDIESIRKYIETHK